MHAERKVVNPVLASKKFIICWPITSTWNLAGSQSMFVDGDRWLLPKNCICSVQSGI